MSKGITIVQLQSDFGLNFMPPCQLPIEFDFGDDFFTTHRDVPWLPQQRADNFRKVFIKLRELVVVENDCEPRTNWIEFLGLMIFSTHTQIKIIKSNN